VTQIASAIKNSVFHSALSIVSVAKRNFYRKGRQAREGLAKQLQRKAFAELCDLRTLGGDQALSQQALASFSA
jgi:hypothetical protein